MTTPANKSNSVRRIIVFCLPGIGDTVDLWAPERIVVGGADFRFVRWKLDGADGQSREKHLQVTMNTPHAAIGIYRLVADMNGDCVVNILDLIIARNRLLQDVNSGENWLADVDDNGRINVLDMILIRNRLGNKCM